MYVRCPGVMSGLHGSVLRVVVSYTHLGKLVKRQARNVKRKPSAADFRDPEMTTDEKIAHANRVWARSRRCTQWAFAVGCYEHINGVGIYREHGTYCAFGTRKDGSRAGDCFKQISKARKYARRKP